MRLRRITLHHLRNLAPTTLTLGGRLHFIIGGNAQGKTSILEAMGFVTALRSFRTHDARLMIAHGQSEAAIGIEAEHERQGDTRVVIRLRGGSKEVSVDDERVTRLGDFLGKFPTVVFSSQDQQLLRGSPTGRRRWLDLTLAAMDPSYLAALQGYHRALAGRNALLKRAANDAEIAAFEHPLAQQGAWLMAARAEGLRHLAEQLQNAYLRITPTGAQERVGFRYVPDLELKGEAPLRELWASRRARDVQFRSTLQGPHRDDFEFTLAERLARDVASEGQQRTLVLALRLAQADWFLLKSGVAPVILADDVLGELDDTRRAGFWSALPTDWQVIATGTRLPDTEPAAWTVHTVVGGRLEGSPESL